MAVKADLSDLMRFVEFLNQISDKVQSRQETAVMAAGHAYQADVQKRAPVDTGQYRSSIRTDQIGNATTGPIAAIGSPMPQTLRLEYGFMDKTDKLERHYYQPAQPHWRPAWDLGITRYQMIMMEELLRDVKMK